MAVSSPSEVAEVCVEPRDVVVLIGMYPDDVDDLWPEEGGLVRAGTEEVHAVLDPNGERTVPQLHPPRSSG